MRIDALHAGGPSKETASISFGPHLTFITGPSDTGKSHIVECIDYVLGAGDEPRKFKESAGYQWMALDLDVSGKPTFIRRRLQSKEVLVFDGSLEDHDEEAGQEMTIKAARVKPADRLSGWLALKSGFDLATPVVRNRQGETQALSFRTVAPFVIVDEKEVIKEGSPAVPVQVVQQTPAKSIFRLMLTGEAPSAEELEALQAAHSVKEEAKQEASILKTLIDQLQEEIEADGATRSSLERDLRFIDEELAQVSELVAESGSHVRSLLGRRNEALASADEARTKAMRATERSERFGLLRRHYDADLRRLEFVLEGGHFFDQLTASHCPSCGRPLEAGAECHPEGADIDKIESAARVEMGKLHPKVDDLSAAIVDAKSEAAEALESAERSDGTARRYDDEIRLKANPTAATAKARVAAITSRRREIESALVPQRQLSSYNEQLQRASIKAERVLGGVHQALDPESVESFVAEVNGLLSSWKFPVTSLRFDPATEDLTINGQARSGSGKGVRAVTHSAFAIGLARHCYQQGRPHPGFVVIDTPLRNFRGTDEDHEDPNLRKSLHAACLENLAASDLPIQTILVDNVDPPESLGASGATVHRFTKRADRGRAGFYPVLETLDPPDPPLEGGSGPPALQE